MKLVLVDDNKVFREGLEFFITERLNYEVIQVYKDGKDLLDLCRCKEADIILVDIEMPALNGLDLANILLSRYPKAKIIAITNHKEPTYLEELIKIGFKGCVYKDYIYQYLSLALYQVKNNGIFFPNDISIN